MDVVQEVPAKLRLRLMVAMPVLLALFMLCVGIGIAFFSDGLAVPREVPRETARQIVVTWILLMAGLAFAGNFVAALIMSRHLRSFMLKVDRIIRRSASPPQEIKAGSEIGALGVMLDEATMTLDRFINDSYIIDSLPEAVITVSADRRIVGVNSNAAKLLRISGLGVKLENFIPENQVSQGFYNLLEHGFKGRPMQLRLVRVPIRSRTAREYWVGVTPARKDAYSGETVSVTIKDNGSIRAIRNQIRKIEQLAAMGKVASSMAHEVRNPLGAIRTLVELIQEDIPHEDSKAVLVAEALKQVDRLNHLIEDVLAFSRDSVVNVREIVVQDLLAGVVSTAKLSFPESAVQVHENYRAAPVATVRGDPEKLFQALLNLLVNAIEACGGSGWISVGFDCEREADELRRLVCINVADSGQGIPPEALGRVFEPFFTTKPTGTGLGLALAYNIINAHGGKIEVYSEPGRGTTFRVILPESHHFMQAEDEEDWSDA